MIEICNKKDCTGCFSCFNTCPKNAIEMREDNVGNVYPVINQEKCINCGLCKKKCPQINSVSFNEPITAYAMYNNDYHIRDKSTSGGAATTFYLKVLNEDGVVYGANNIENGKFSFIRITKASDLYKVKGSKYVHCYIEDKYSMAKKDLEKGLKVLFIGTPCQIAGLRAFLGKEYDNLLTVDLVCHGVPSQKMLIEEIKMHANYDKVSKITFRENDFNLRIYENSKCVFSENRTTNYYYSRFMSMMFFRENCYSCKYAQRKRISDITIGDFWCLNTENEKFRDKDKGISLVIPNTKRGVNFVESCIENMVYEERTIEEAIEGNEQLKHPSTKNKLYNKFMRLYQDKGYEIACKKTQSLKQKLKKIKIINKMYYKIKGR